MEQKVKDKVQLYYQKLHEDFAELKDEYPFSSLIIPPTTNLTIASVKVIAVCKKILNAVDGKPEDFTGMFSKELYIEMPMNYWDIGCNVYGCKWFNEKKFNKADVHLFRSEGQFEENMYGYKICVGTPASFKHMKNVLLEAVKTADNILVAYERVQAGISRQVILNAYSHGDVGEKEYLKDRNRYVSR